MILYCTLIWVIAENDGTGWLTYRECFILFRGSYTNSWKARLHAGQFRVNCLWILPTGVNEVPYARAKDIDFLSPKKIWSKKSLTRELRIYNSRKPGAIQQLLVLGCIGRRISPHRQLRKNKWLSFMPNSTSEKIKAIALSLIDPFADQFIDQSCLVSVVPERSFCHKLVHSLSSLLFVASPRLAEDIHCFSS